MTHLINLVNIVTSIGNLMRFVMVEFKAGDFTSGKMSDIFKACYLKDIAIINHKQFGKSYMVPEVFFKEISLSLLLSKKKFKEFVNASFGSEKDLKEVDDEDLLQEIEEFFGGVMIDNWFDVLSHAMAM